MSNGTKVKKRDGRIESLDLDKMHLMVDEACQGLAGVSASQVEICLLYTSPSPRDLSTSRMPSSA